ncbi:MAG: hypothetical protein LBJ72_09715 [Dysgonamonadaceae bacterium]|jgi:hypothetical protein|nr:hypothetical protein [Dysgonamonadaceae bacterium]
MATILHRIKVCLYDNPLTKEDLTDYVARVSSEQWFTGCMRSNYTSVWDRTTQTKENQYRS